MLINCDHSPLPEVPTTNETLPIFHRQLHTFMLLCFGDATPLIGNTLLSYLHVLTDTPSRSSANASSCIISPYSLLQPWECTSNVYNDRNWPLDHGCTLNFIGVLVQRPYCPWAAPRQCPSVTGTLRQTHSWEGPDICDAGIGWRTPKSWTKHPWAIHTCI